MKTQLLVAKVNNEIIRFDADGRIYRYEAQIDSYLPTTQFTYLDYFDIPMFMLPPEYLNAGWREPIEHDVTYEVFDE